MRLVWFKIMFAELHIHKKLLDFTQAAKLSQASYDQVTRYNDTKLQCFFYALRCSKPWGNAPRYILQNLAKFSPKMHMHSFVFYQTISYIH